MSLLHRLKNAGIRFSFCTSAVYPQIPYIKDVLYVLRLVKEGYGYDMGMSNFQDYCGNVHLVAAAVGESALLANTEEDAKRFIAEAIDALSPLEAFGNQALEEARALLSSSGHS